MSTKLSKQQIINAWTAMGFLNIYLILFRRAIPKDVDSEGI